MISPVTLDSRRTLKKISVSVKFCYITKHFKTKWLTTTTKRKRERKTLLQLTILRGCSLGHLCLSGSSSLGPDSANISWELTHLWSAVELAGNWLVYDGSAGMAYLCSCGVSSSRRLAWAWLFGGSSRSCKSSKRTSSHVQALFKLLPLAISRHMPMPKVSVGGH